MSVEVIVAVIGAVGLVLAAVMPVLIGIRRGVEEVHVEVNSRLTEALSKIERLEKALNAERREA